MTAAVSLDVTAPYLAFDTSGTVGSVTIGRGTDPLATVRLERRSEHAACLVPAIDDVLASAHVGGRDLRGVVVGEGPGSFTGVRVAAATAKGLACALAIPLWAVSSLAATALSAGRGPVRYALFDARSDRVYGACYGVGSVGVETLVAPHAGGLRDVLGGNVPAGAVFVGDAAERHRAAIEGAGFEVAEPESSVAVAEGLLAYLELARDERPIADVGLWEPRYLRPSGAEPSWTR